jgi:two-component system cell cycle sensor histidine kinase/response regulator CckA
VLSVTDVLQELMHLLRRLIGENIQLDVIHGRSLWEVKVDQGQLEQVIINLAVNARDAMAERGGELAIRTSNQQLTRPLKREGETVPPGDYVLIEVADSGCGIAQENLDRIFEPFFSTKEVGAGTGLGLSTVYGIVKQTGGFILVDSAPGVGTNFQIYLPRHQQAAGEPTPGKSAQSQVTDLTGMGTLLLVEDEDAVRAFSARALRKKGYDVLEASSGEHALDVMGQQGDKVDLLITDVVMPNLDGPTLVRRVRETYPDVKVIFISGYTEDSFRRNLGEESDIHFLGKPFTLKQLAGMVKDVLYADAS